MMRKARTASVRTRSAGCLLAGAVLLVAPAGAAELDWFTIDAGGGTSSAGLLVLVGSIGQADAGVSVGGSFELSGGFLSSGTPAPSGCGPADLVEPLGSLDLFDILGFFELFSARDPSVDFAEPAGVLDLFDILEFFSLFGAGC